VSEYSALLLLGAVPLAGPGLLPHLLGFDTTRRAPNRTRTARHGGLPPVCRSPKYALDLCKEDAGKTTRSKSFWIQLLIRCGQARTLVVGQVLSMWENTGGANSCRPSGIAPAKALA